MSGALCQAPAAGVVDGVVAGQQKLGDGEEGIALLQRRLDDAGQRLQGLGVRAFNGFQVSARRGPAATKSSCRLQEWNVIILLMVFVQNSENKASCYDSAVYNKLLQ